MAETKVAILASGGIDSTVLIYRYAHLKPTIIVIDFGQRGFREQIKMVDFHAAKLDLNVVVLKATIPKEVRDEGMFEPFKADDKEMDKIYDKDIRNDLYKGYWIEGRNYYLTIPAIGYCSRNKIPKLITGYQMDKEDWNELGNINYRTKDTTPHFIAILNVISNCGFKNYVSVEAPFFTAAMDRFEIVVEALKAGIDLNKTISCHFNNNCGKCIGCIEREERFKWLNGTKKS